MNGVEVCEPQSSIWLVVWWHAIIRRLNSFEIWGFIKVLFWWLGIFWRRENVCYWLCIDLFDFLTLAVAIGNKFIASGGTKVCIAWYHAAFWIKLLLSSSTQVLVKPCHFEDIEKIFGGTMLHYTIFTGVVQNLKYIVMVVTDIASSSAQDAAALV